MSTRSAWQARRGPRRTLFTGLQRNASPRPGLRHVAKELSVPAAEVYPLITYADFRKVRVAGIQRDLSASHPSQAQDTGSPGEVFRKLRAGVSLRLWRSAEGSRQELRRRDG